MTAKDNRRKAGRHRGAWSPFRSLRLRITLVFLIPSCVVLIAGWIPLRARSSSSATIDRHLQVLANHTAEGVSQRVGESLDLTKTLAADAALSNPRTGQETRETRLKYYYSLSPFVEGLTLIDATGPAVASTDSTTLVDWSDRQVFRDALSGSASISPPFLSSSEPPAFSVVAAAPVRHQGIGQPWAVLAVQLPLAYFTGPVEAVSVEETGFGFMVDSTGQKLQPGPQAGPIQRWHSPAASGLIAQGQGVRVSQESGQGRVYAVATVPGMVGADRWLVVLQVPASEAYGDLKDISRLFLIVGIGLIALISIAALAMATLVSGPVLQVARAARELRGGNLSYRVRVHDSTELGELARAFNSMASELEARMAEIQESRRRIVTVQEGVRRDIAEQLHGPVQTQLLVLWHLLGETGKLLGAGKQAEAAQLLNQVRGELQRLQDKEIRGLSHRLHPSIVRVGVSASMRSLRDQFGKLMPVKLTLDEMLVSSEKERPALLPPELRLVLYRVAEEALNNVVKHAEATEASVTVEYQAGERVTLTVADNGKGIPPGAAEEGLGLRTMRDYAEALRGTCEVTGRPGAGTTVRVTLPLPTAPESPTTVPEAAEPAPPREKTPA